MNPCVLVSGDFTPWGGMDRANYELAWYLADSVGAAVQLVSHRVASPLVDHPRVTWHRVPKPLESYTLGGPLLAARGRQVARAVAPKGRVIVNGGNCAWPDVNWVHYVHAAWDGRHETAPVAFRARAALTRRAARYGERVALRAARVVLANSDHTRRQVIELLGVPPERVHTVYYGVGPHGFHPATPRERLAARQRLGLPEARPIVAFVGALGYDRRKAFDVVFDAWQILTRDPAWDVDLVTAGGGAEVEFWRRRATISGLGDRVRILGFTELVPDLLAAADGLVSPTYYEAYGLAVHEALCSGLPAFVTRSAGIAERYPADLDDLLLDDPPVAQDIVRRMNQWRRDRAGYAERVAGFGAALRRRTWADMASEIAALLTQAAQPVASPKD